MNKDSVVGGGYLRERGPTQAEFSSVVNPDRNTWGKSRDLRKVPGYERAIPLSCFHSLLSQARSCRFEPSMARRQPAYSEIALRDAFVLRLQEFR
jgi:hypothetical protein